MGPGCLQAPWGRARHRAPRLFSLDSSFCFKKERPLDTEESRSAAGRERVAASGEGGSPLLLLCAPP